jgi:hypothetical protein
MEYGLQLPWQKHYSVLDFLTSSAFLLTYHAAREEIIGPTIE